jgi:uncharacterized protein
VGLPVFRYHPNPIATGVVVRSDNQCVVCGQRPGFVYNGIPHCREEIDERSICPWCIADGSAHDRLNATFTNRAMIGAGLVPPEPVFDAVVEEIAYRTPGFNAWQSERWFAHCEDGAAFLGAMGCAELNAAGPAALEAIRASTGLEGEDWDAFLGALDRADSPCAYLFRCLHCGQFGGYTDAD